MKKEIHPPYQQVLFVDSASGHKFVCGSALKPEGKEVFQGKEYPVYYLSISSTSHPFFTGSKQLVDSEGRVEKFKRRFDKKKEVASDDSSNPRAAFKPRAAFSRQEEHKSSKELEKEIVFEVRANFKRNSQQREAFSVRKSSFAFLTD